MRIHVKSSWPLIMAYPVKETCQQLDLTYLHAALREEDNEQTLRRMLTVLRANQYMTIRDVLQSSWQELSALRQMGVASCLLLGSLLERITQQPDLLVDEAVAQREQKLHSIKERLREMGLVK